MSKRINIILPDSTVAILDRVARKGNRSRFIDRAVLSLIKTEGTAILKARLKAGALANAKLNLELAEERFPVEQAACDRLEREEQAAAKPIPSAGKSTSRRSIPLDHQIKKTRPALIIQNDVSNQYTQPRLWRPSPQE